MKIYYSMEHVTMSQLAKGITASPGELWRKDADKIDPDKREINLGYGPLSLTASSEEWDEVIEQIRMVQQKIMADHFTAMGEISPKTAKAMNEATHDRAEAAG